jgi:heterodisulfide reductase subunit A-like polyferredoxin/coenzyme F420-reducing hydrogenase delta subunit
MNIGLFLSEGDGDISKVVDVKALASEYAAGFPVSVFGNFHNTESHKAILRDVEDKQLEAVVLAGESPLFYKKTRNGERLISLLHAAGINPNLISFTNIREQVALPHRSMPEEATKKAKVLIDVSIEKVRLSQPVEMIEVSPRRAVAVIGTTAAGLFAAQRLLDRNFQIDFIDREELRDLKQFRRQTMPTLASIRKHPNTRFHSTNITDFYGYAGNFRINLEGEKKIRAGGVIVAVGDDLKFTADLYPFLRLERDERGLFKTLSSDTAVTETVQQGIFLIPEQQTLASAIAMADSAAMSCDALLSRNAIKHELFVSQVDEDVCGGCGTCIKTCIFHAAEIDPANKISSTNIKRCVGCGNCVSACPTGARDQVSGSTAYYLSAIDILASYQPPTGSKLLYVVCEGCGYPSLDYAGTTGIEYPTSVMPLSVRCAGRLDTQFILEAFKKGFTGVVICKCKDDHCLNIVGNTDLDRRANLFRAVLSSRGISPDRLRIFGVSDCDGASCVTSAVEFMNYLKNMGRA